MSGTAVAKPPQQRPIRATTALGSWAVRLAAAFVVLSFAWRLLGPLGGFPSLLCGIAAGVVALIAIVRRGERALLVFASTLPLLLVVAFLLVEFLVGHD